jgi:coenzyme F420 hydrogenase subunit delta
MNDILPAFCSARVLVLGVGNLLFGDDGFGPAVARWLSDHYMIPDDLYVMDVGTGVRKLLFTLALSESRPEEIIIVDAVDWAQVTGSVVEISAESLPVTKIDDFSLHQVPTSNLLCELQERCGVKVIIVACDVGAVPQRISPGLSPATLDAVVLAGQKIASRLSLIPKALETQR